MFNPDRPIESSKDDILGRHEFAQSLAKAMLSYKVSDCIVIGLFGDWGSGKTSIINMTLEHIETESESITEDNKPIIVQFNPWNFSEQDQLIIQFFKQLSLTLRQSDYTENIRDAGQKLEEYAKFFKPLAPTILGLVENLGNTLKGWGDITSGDLKVVKKELVKLLREQPHKIIIIIDDIDRLNNKEIRQIFQLIKSLGDFPNTIYLVAFDKDVVKRALEDVQKDSGAKYLEKVIQVPFEVPSIHKNEVEQLLFSQLGVLLKDISKEKWDQVDWGNIYYGGLQYFFKNIRDVTRFINTLRFSFMMVKDNVNPIDFFAITAFQVFIPDVYYGIRDNKDLFSGIFTSSSDAIKEQAKIRCDEIIGRADESIQNIVKELLLRLFPKLEYIYGNTQYSSNFLNQWRRDEKICSPDIFEMFFRLSGIEGEIYPREIKTILSLAENPESLTETLLSLKEDGRIVKFLEYMKDYAEDIPMEHVEPIIKVLMDIGDLFPDHPTGFFKVKTSTKIGYLIDSLIHRFNNREERFRILKNVMEGASESLYTSVYFISRLGREYGKYSSEERQKPEENPTINEAQLRKLEILVSGKIKEWALNSRLSTHEGLSFILYVWKELGNHEDANEFVNYMMETDDRLISFITGFLEEYVSQSVTDHVATVHQRIHIKGMENYVDIKKIEPRVKRIYSSSNFKQLDDKKKNAIIKFIETVDKEKNTHD